MNLKLKISIIVVFFGVLTGCNDTKELDTEQLNLEQEELILESLEIKQIAESVDCTDSDDWAFIPLGSKACGGPIEYIAYPTTINTVSFLEKVEAFKVAQNAFNIKWGIISDCSVATPPVEIVCENDKAVLKY